MLEGLMQHDHPLTLQLLLQRMRRLYAGTEVVSVRGGERTRATYAEVAERADRLCSALASLGVGPGDRVATFSWNTREHLEAYLAVPCMGAVLHTLNVRLFADQLEYVVGHAEDQVIPVVPMFHANAWGIPYASVLTGAGLVMPGSDLSSPALAELIAAERVTLSAAVPTIWMDLLRYADEQAPDLSSVRLVICGGSAVPLSLMQQFEERHGVKILQAWGMTETSPLGSVARPPAGVEEPELWRYRSTQGRPASLVEARLVRPGGEDVPWDGKSTGELEVRGPWVARRYYGDDAGEEKFDDGWLRTGDIAAIDEAGYIIISDRTKDVIKSGGEWISSVELENEIMAHPSVREAAVIARPDERWGERPLACVVPEEGETLTLEELCEHLAPRVAKWWLPDALEIVDKVPKTSVGKFDKKVLRAQLAGQESAGARGA